MNPEAPRPGSESEENSGKQLGQELEQIHQEQSPTPPAAPETKDGRFRRFIRNAAVVAGVGGLIGGGAEVASQHSQKPESAPTPTTAPETPAETQETAAFREFNPGELEKIFQVGNLESVKDHRFEITRAYAQSEKQQITEISMDGERPKFDLNTLMTGQQFFNQLAEKGTSVNFHYTPEGQAPRTATYELKPRSAENRYFIFAPSSVDMSQFNPNVSQVSKNAEALTNCANDICVSILKPSQEKLDPLIAQQIDQGRINALTEVAKTSIDIAGGGDEDDSALAADNIYAGYGTAFAFAERSLSFEQYQKYAEHKTLPEDERQDAVIHQVDQETYDQMISVLTK